MLVDCRELESGTTIQADVCVVGSGFAGISLALELAYTGARVALLESGGLEESDEHKDLLNGTFDGPHKNKSYLRSSRSRHFGGTSAKWLGVCRPMDPIDFQERPWVPESGWPFDETELAPYYRRAAPLLKIRPFETFDGEGALAPSNPLTGPDVSRFVPKALLRGRPIARFGDEHRRALVDSPSVTVYLHANALELSVHEDGSGVREVVADNFARRRIRFQARDFVLAAGAFDCARLLLASRRQQPAGLGNTHDLVGRYYMDHTRLPECGQMIRTDTSRRRGDHTGRAAVEGPFYYAVFSPNRKTQRDLRMLNCGVKILGFTAADAETLGEVARPVGGLARGLDETLRQRAEPAGRAKVEYSTKLYNEHVPLFHSRVRLDSERDPLGQPRLVVEWRSNAQMDRSVERTLELFALEMGRLARGRLRLTPAEPLYSKPCFLGSHPMGTTRMHGDPKRGVVDADCRVHGLDNLFIASSSVFPTGGFVNPTYTIVALALRLADHLRARHAARG